MPNEHGWQRIRKVMPQAVAYAIDSSGMQCAFDSPPIYHHTGRWIPTGTGTRMTFGLVPTGMGFDGSKTLQWAPDYLGDRQVQVEIQEQHDQNFPPEDSPVPDRRATDPTVAGPDAFGQAQDESMTAADLVQANLEAMGLAPKKPREKPVQVSPTAPAGMIEEPVTDEVVTAGPDEVMRDLVIALAEMLPRTKKAKVQDLLNHLKGE